MDKTQLGFGSYRVSSRSAEHKEALKKALEFGCSLIDTSSNYTDGQSEVLIGEVLKETGYKPIIVSKVGYIQGQNLEIIEELNKNEKAVDDLVEITEYLKHSIHPDFIFDQVDRSLQRLGLDCLDVYLLHNPEYYLKTEKSTSDEYYKRIEKAFVALEQLVEHGKIKSYGISSNTFIVNSSDHDFTNLDTVFSIAKKVKEDHNFKYIQFPLNLLELGALERVYDEKNLIEFAQELGLKTMINRPFNAFTTQGLVRLASYKVADNIKHENADEIFNHYIASLVDKWNEQKESDDEGLFEVPMMNQFKSMWFQQKSIDGVEELFFRYFFPFVAQVWGKDVSPKESQPFYDLFDIACEFARKNMNDRAQNFKEQAIEAGILKSNGKDLDILAIEKYKTFGVDYILVGMKRLEYVEKLKKFF